MDGIVGRLLREFSLTLTFAILVSTLVSLTVTPMICAHYIRQTTSGTATLFDRLIEGSLSRIVAFYARTLRTVLEFPLLTLLVFFATIALTVTLYIKVPKGYFPTDDSGFVIGATRASADISFQSMLGAAIAVGLVAAAPLSAHAAAPAACAALQEKYPDWKGKTLVNAINPHTPGYETIDPKDPSKYIGFDIDLGEAIGECLGFKLTYKPVTFAALLTTLAAGQADIVISDIYATKERAKAADFITYSKVFDGVLVAKGNPKGINGINMH